MRNYHPVITLCKELNQGNGWWWRWGCFGFRSRSSLSCFPHSEGPLSLHPSLQPACDSGFLQHWSPTHLQLHSPTFQFHLPGLENVPLSSCVGNPRVHFTETGHLWYLRTWLWRFHSREGFTGRSILLEGAQGGEATTDVLTY